jgi:hypothetical protein
MKSTATATIYFEDGSEVTHVNVTYARWGGNRDERFIVQRYDPADESRLQTFVYKREHVKNTVRVQDDTPEVNLTEEKPKS